MRVWRHFTKFTPLAIGALVLTFLQTGCGSDDPCDTMWCPDTETSANGSGGSDGAGSAGGSAAGKSNKGKEMFLALQEPLVTACGACHTTTKSNTPFLGEPDTKNPDPYETITSWPDFIVKDATNSLLLTHPQDDAHTNKFKAELEEVVQAWLEEESKGVADVSEDTKPTTTPIKPVMGFNAIYLDSLNKKFGNFEGMSITFRADELTPKSLSLFDITVYATNQFGVAMKHPLLSVYPKGSAEADPDPIDSFSNVETLVKAGEAGQLGPGSVILTNWKSGGKLSFAFETIETVEKDDSLMGGCNALQDFADNVVTPLQNNCTTCHGGNLPQAQNAVDMSALQAGQLSEEQLQEACSQVRNRINLENPAVSQLFITTDPNGNATHPYKFGTANNPSNAFDDFAAAITLWIEQEKK